MLCFGSGGKVSKDCGYLRQFTIQMSSKPWQEEPLPEMNGQTHFNGGKLGAIHTGKKGEMDR